MRVRREDTIVLGVLLIVLVVAAVLVSSTMTERKPPTSETTTSRAGSVQITVDAGQRGQKWVRSPTDDLPQFATGVNWNICNVGTAVADNTRIVVKSDKAVVFSSTTPLHPNDCASAYVDLNYPYDTVHEVTVEASSGQSKDSRVLIISSDLPRYLLDPKEAPSPELMEFAELFITPHDPMVERAASQIWNMPTLSIHCASARTLSDCFPEHGDAFVFHYGIEAWTEANIVLAPDETHRVSGHAQLPRETLQLGKGDMEDIAILMVSMARAVGFAGGRSLFVVLGLDSDQTHTYGWLGGTTIELLCKVGTIPPSEVSAHFGCQFSGLWYLGYDGTTRYTPVYYFNDEIAEAWSQT